MDNDDKKIEITNNKKEIYVRIPKTILFLIFFIIVVAELIKITRNGENIYIKFGLLLYSLICISILLIPLNRLITKNEKIHQKIIEFLVIVFLSTFFYSLIATTIYIIMTQISN